MSLRHNGAKQFPFQWFSRSARLVCCGAAGEVQCGSNPSPEYKAMAAPAYFHLLLFVFAPVLLIGGVPRGERCPGCP